MAQFNDASRAFWDYVIGNTAGVEIKTDDDLRSVLAEGIAGDIVWPGSALTSESSNALMATQRLDRQNASASRSGGSFAAISYTDAPEITEDWTNLSAWSTALAQVSGNRYYASGTGTVGAIRSYSVAPNENAHIAGLLYWKAGGSAPIYFGIDVGAAGHAPAASSPDGLLLGFSGAGGKAQFVGSNAGVSLSGTTLVGSNPVVDTTYAWSIDIDDNYISYSMHALGSASDSAVGYVSRAALVAAGKSINNISLYIGDSRGLTGHSFGPVVAVKSRQPSRTKTIAGTLIEGADHRHTVTSPTSGGDGWRFSLPANYDSRKPSPIVIYCHQSLTGSQHTAWSESRMQPVTQALLNAGYIVAAANDGGDRWGNQASLDNYLALYRFLRDKFNTGSIFILGISMGSLVALNALTHSGWPTPSAVATVGGVVDLDTLFVNNTGPYAAGIRAAYGIAADGSDYESKTSGYNPVDRNGYEFRGVPFRLYTSAGDTAVPAGSNQNVLSSKVSGYSPEANIILGSGGHLDPSQFQASDIVSFFNTYLT